MGSAASTEAGNEENVSAWTVLKQQDAISSGHIIQTLEGNETFEAYAKAEAESIVGRDNEDAEKLQAGIQISIDAGVLPTLDPPPEYVNIDVMGKTSDDVCNIIVEHVGQAASTGCVIVLCGLSGTGKGTTVAKLTTLLPNTTTWSNGNVFRSLTLLAATWCEQQEGLEGFDGDLALTMENLEAFMAMLEFDKFNEQWDIRINGLGIDCLVSEVKNTELKGPKVSKNIPTVAKVTQGQVVKFAADATKKMGEDGLNVLLEGREATVNYVETPYRYCLVMSDTTVLGQRRAAQIIGATALKNLGPDTEDVPSEDVINSVTAALAELTSTPA